MQALNVPAGEHNPNGYTAAEILDELRGVRGSRKITYRYDLLDSTDAKIRDLVEVESCTVEQDWLADIKRKASFTIRDAPDIDWLSHRIKPWVQLRMPPRVQNDGEEINILWTNTCDGASGAVTPANSLTGGDPFSTVTGTAVRTTSWKITGTHSISLGTASTTTTGELTLGIPARTTWRKTIYANIPAGSYLKIAFETVGDVLVEDVILDDSAGATYQLGSVDITAIKSNLFDQPIRIEIIRDLHRVRYLLYWTSPTATVADFITTEDASTWAAVHQFRITGGGHSAGVALIDSPSVGVPGDPELIPRIRPFWRNGFNGTPGEQATVSNLGSFGSVPTEMNGLSYYSSSWSADSLRSLQLGDALGDNSGEMLITVPRRSAWDLQVYVNVPASGALFILPTGDTAITPPETEEVPITGGPPAPAWRDPNWIVLDDLNGEYLIAGTDVSASAADLIGQPVRIELETDGTTYSWRVYWTDPTGRAPDRSWGGDATSWVELRAVLVAGGGDAMPPPLIDNLRIGDPLPVTSLTPDSVNYVEWPQGVFLLTTPSRTVDDFNVVRRDVQGFDKGLIVNDDLTDGHIASSGIPVVTDSFKRSLTSSYGKADTGQSWAAEVVTTSTYGVGRSPRAWAWLKVTSDTTIIRQLAIPSPTVNLRDTEVRASLTVSALPTAGTGAAGARIGVSMRHQAFNVTYLVGLNITPGGVVSLEGWCLYPAGVTQIGSTTATGITITAGQFVELRARVIDHKLQARIWIDGDPEPVLWTYSATVSANTVTNGGVGVWTCADGTFANTSTLEFRWRSFSAYASPIGKVTDLVEVLLGDLPKIVAPSSTVLAADMEWEAGTSKRQMINDLLDAINYESLSFNEDGVAIVRPYVSPDTRPSEYEYADDEVSVLYPDMTQELDLYQVPNRWILVVSEADRAPVKVVYENRDPASPTSIPSRGRVITAYVTDQQASDRATLIETAVRHGFESTQVFEAVEFDTAAMPFHSGNDVYTVRRGPLGVASKYTEQSWSLKFQAGEPMSHRARRVVSFDTDFDDTILTEDLVVTGALEAGNMAYGVLQITPVANTPTSGTVTGLDLQGTGRVIAACTSNTTVPGSTVKESTIYNPTPFGVTLYVTRTNTTQTGISWLLIREV